MRRKLSLAVSAVVLTAGTAVMLAAPSATATACPPGSIGREVKLPTGATYRVCVPIGPECDPGPCPSTAAPQRD